MNDRTTAVRAAISAMAEPLREQLAEIERQLEEAEQTVSELREARSQARRMLTLADPNYEIPGKPGRPKKAASKTGVSARVSDETVAAVEKRLHDQLSDVNGNGGFTITSLRRDFGFDDYAQSTLQKAVAVLHERDLVRLDHRGRGGAHYFKVVV